jgi:CheY-like chemotaxis protein/two-component sensor histidine kinase
VLLVEDSEDDALLMLRALRDGGFDPQHLRVDNREAFQQALQEASWDVVLSDYSMPGFDGMAAFELCRASGLEVPFLFVSGHIGEERAVEAMRRGASDYLTKDKLGRLAAAVERELRESEIRRQKREMSDALASSEARLQRLAQNAPDIIYEYQLEPGPRFAYVSPAATAIIGYTPQEHYEDPGLWRRIVRAEDRPLLDALLLPTDHGPTTGGIMLTVIAGYCSVLRYKLQSDEARLRDLSRIESATERSASLVRQLLAFSRRQARDLKVLEFGKVLTEFAPMFRRMIGEDIEVELLTSAEPNRVRADRSQMEQVLMNLVVNARDAMPDGGRITLEVETEQVDALVTTRPLSLQPGRYVRLTVSDTGSGMPESVRERIFDPFFTTKDVGKGTGLGLSTVYGIVKQMDGDIWVYSEPGMGTTFKIYLPCVEGDPIPEEAAGLRQPLDGQGTILLVEDEEMVREAAAEILATHGYTIFAAGNGADALRLLARHEREIDLLLTDVVMPNMNGIELSERVRERNPAIRVLYTTGYSDASLPGQCSPNGAAALLQKPFSSQSLLERVREALGGRD